MQGPAVTNTAICQARRRPRRSPAATSSHSTAKTGPGGEDGFGVRHAGGQRAARLRERRDQRSEPRHDEAPGREEPVLPSGQPRAGQPASPAARRTADGDLTRRDPRARPAATARRCSRSQRTPTYTKEMTT